MRFSLIFSLLFVAATPVSGQSVRSGIDAWQKGDAASAVAIWRSLAEKGDADAAFNLGQAYRLGKGVPLDLSQAQSWLEKAARKGHVDAQATLGLLLFQNGNRVGGMRWLKSAADAGEPRALLLYGTALFNGDGVAEDPVTAYAYVSRAAAQGLAPAKATLADMDAVMPVDQRQKGVALAKAMADGNKSAVLKPVSPKPKAAPIVAATPKAKAAPVGPIVPTPPVSATAAGRWRAQLGAFGQRKSAEQLFAKIGGRFGGARAFYVPAGAVVRLQVGPFASRAAAAAACRSVAPQPCFPVEAR